jgi:hypothetical protein
MQQDRLSPALHVKNRRTAWFLAGLILGLTLYSLTVIKIRGKLPEPMNLTPVQKILRGL